MKLPSALIAATIAAALPVRAVYAPIPEQDKGKDLLLSVRAGYTYDTNIFGAPAHTDVYENGAIVDTITPISSNVWEVAPHITYNHSLSDRTFLSAAYGLVVDYFQDRPGEKTLPSHDVTLRLAHAFTQTSTLDVTEDLAISRNPESLLPLSDVPVATDQSLTHNQLDGRYNTDVTPKAGIEVKARSQNFDYHNESLSRLLDRIENIYGLAGNYAVLPELKAVAEVRHQDVFYWTDGEDKNKHSNYLMGGFDYAVAKKLSVTARFGGEWREREGAPDTSAPFVELSGEYHYGERSFITGGYGHTFDEASDPTRFTDQQVNRYFVTMQHALTALIVASVAIDYEPAVLKARPGLTPPAVDLNETTKRIGAALSYVPNKNWTISATFDYDRVISDDPSRTTQRHRYGINTTYAF